jgi:archaemetzincin
MINNYIKILKGYLFLFPLLFFYSHGNAQKVVLIPMGKISDELVSITVRKLKENGVQVVLKNKEEMSAETYYKPRKRYRADKIIASLRKRAGKNEVYLAITSQDISTSVHNQKDFGVMGLGYVPGNASVVSSFRIKNKNFLYRIALHEIGHNKGIDHCPSKNCFMMDAEKKDRTSEMLLFCDKCKKKWN